MSFHTKPEAVTESNQLCFFTLEPKRAAVESVPRRATYADATAAICAMKGVNMIEVDRDDRLIGLLMELPVCIVVLVRRRFKFAIHGYPTVDVVDSILEDLENEGCFGPDVDRFN